MHGPHPGFPMISLSLTKNFLITTQIIKGTYTVVVWGLCKDETILWDAVGGALVGKVAHWTQNIDPPRKRAALHPHLEDYLRAVSP
jgi:hypothetical protein